MGGNVIFIEAIKDGNKIRVGMAHLSEISVTNGAVVKEGQIVGKIGNTGSARSLGPAEHHVHLSVRVNGKLVNPQSHFRDNPSTILKNAVDRASASAGAGGTTRSLRFDP